MWEKYHSVTSIAEVLGLLDQYQERARIVAGGTDIMIELERGQRPDVDVLIDITRISGLNQIAIRGDQIRLGALVTHNDVVADKRLEQIAYPLVQACWEVGAPQIRNRATVVGNLITGSPANDTITPLLAMDAEVTLSSVVGERTVPLSEFYTGLRRTVMRPNEMMTAVSFQGLSDSERGQFYKLGLRRAQAIAVINAAVVLKFEHDVIRHATITLGSVAPTVIRVPTAEQALIGQTLTTDVIAEVARLASITPSPIDDVRATADYRREMIRVIVGRLLTMLAEGDMGSPAWGEQPVTLRNRSDQGAVLPNASVHEAGVSIDTTINGKSIALNTGYGVSLLTLLRDHAGLTGTNSGCEEGECGACTVFLDGDAVMSCMVPAPRAHQAEITTIEGLKTGDELHPIQSAFVDEGAVQCGYCTPGFLMAGASLLQEVPNPTRTQIQQSISGNLCRCTGYYKILQAFEKAAEQLAVEGE